jgi:hypothetical protein
MSKEKAMEELRGMKFMARKQEAKRREDLQRSVAVPDTAAPDAAAPAPAAIRILTEDAITAAPTNGRRRFGMVSAAPAKSTAKPDEDGDDEPDDGRPQHKGQEGRISGSGGGGKKPAQRFYPESGNRAPPLPRGLAPPSGSRGQGGKGKAPEKRMRTVELSVEGGFGSRDE